MAANTKIPASSFSIGDKVELLGLQNSPKMNHRVGYVAGELLNNGRYPVLLSFPNAKSKKIAIQPVNLKKMDSNIRTGCCNTCNEVFALNVVKVCDKCQMVEYCSRECQVADWHKEHKKMCKMLQQGRLARHDDTQLPTDLNDRSNVRRSRGLHWMQKGKFAKAEAEYRALVRENPHESIGNYLMLAHAICQQNPGHGKEQESVAFLRKAVDLPIRGEDEKCFCAKAYRHLGDQLLVRTSDLDGAEEAFNEALKLESSSNDQLTVLLVKQGLERIKERRRILASASK